MKTVVLLTGSELRHTYLRMTLGRALGGKLLRTYCESADNNIVAQVEKQHDNPLRKTHLALREETEKDFFESYCNQTEDLSNPVFISKGDINSAGIVADIRSLQPDIIIAYGCSIIKPPLIKHFHNRFINIHLGLSPYYRGSGTNFWPLVNGEPQLVGVTFMYIDEGVDTGQVFHQIRARIFPGDNAHQIGNRLIADVAELLPHIVSNFDRLENIQPIEIEKDAAKYYRKVDFTEASTQMMYDQFASGMIDRYLAKKPEIDAAFPIVQNPAL